MHLAFLVCFELKARILLHVEFDFEGDTFRTYDLIHAFNPLTSVKKHKIIFI